MKTLRLNSLLYPDYNIYSEFEFCCPKEGKKKLDFALEREKILGLVCSLKFLSLHYIYLLSLVQKPSA